LALKKSESLALGRKKPRIKQQMSSKIIIITTVILLIASICILFIMEAKYHEYDYKKTWSVAYFENPRDDSLDFSIENHEGKDAQYAYKVSINDDKVFEGNIEIRTGVKQKISPILSGEKIQGNRVTIEISYKDTNYKIYKDLGK
jgi:hypothetical protein